MVDVLVSSRSAHHTSNFLSSLIITAQNGFCRDVEPFLALCHETWDEEILWDAVKDLPHGPTRSGKAVDPFGKRRTRLMFTAAAGDAERLRWLIARGARLEQRDWLGRTALYFSAAEGQLDAARELLARGAAVDAAMSDGSTPLCVAAQNNHLGVVRELLARGAAVDGGTGRATPLGAASERGHLAVVRELRAHGASLLRPPGPPRSVPAVIMHLHFEEVSRELARARASVAQGAAPSKKTLCG
jgi:ankyrin repeat protein